MPAVLTPAAGRRAAWVVLALAALSVVGVFLLPTPAPAAPESSSGLPGSYQSVRVEELRRELPGTTVVSIAHRPAVADYHDEARVFRRPGTQPGTLEAARPAVPMSSAE